MGLRPYIPMCTLHSFKIFLFFSKYRMFIILWNPSQDLRGRRNILGNVHISSQHHQGEPHLISESSRFGLVKLGPLSLISRKSMSFSRFYNIKLLSQLFLDVRPTVCGWKSGPPRTYFQTAQREDPGHHRLLHQTVPGVLRAVQEENQNLSQVLQTDKKIPRTSRTWYKQRE